MYPKDIIGVKVFPYIFVSQAELELQKKKIFFFKQVNVFLTARARRIGFAISKKIFYFHQFSPESKEYHSHSVSKISFLFFVAIVYY